MSTELVLPIPETLVEAIAERVGQTLTDRQDRRRWAVGVEGLAEYLACPVRFARELRAKGLPAKKIGKRVVFDLREVDSWLEREGQA